MLEITEVCGFEDHEIRTRTLYRWKEGGRSDKDSSSSEPGEADTGRNRGGTMKENYGEYHFSRKEWKHRFLVESVLLCVVFDYLFYQNKWLLVLSVPAAVIFLKLKKKEMIRERKEKFELSVSGCNSVSSSVAVQAGYSVENAVSACARDLERLYPKDTDILKEFHYMESQLKVSVPVEELFLGFAERCSLEDVENFAAVFHTAKRTGGDMNRIIQTSARMLGDKIDVKKEDRVYSGSQKSRTDHHESDAGRNYSLSEADFSGFLKCSLWQSFRNLCHDIVSGNLRYVLLAGT